MTKDTDPADDPVTNSNMDNTPTDQESLDDESSGDELLNITSVGETDEFSSIIESIASFAAVLLALSGAGILASNKNFHEKIKIIHSRRAHKQVSYQLSRKKYLQKIKDLTRLKI